MGTAELVDELITEGVLHTPQIIEAFRHIDRADFVPERLKDEAYVNAPLPIGLGQTISQPLTVAFMLELLQPQSGDKVLDIGSGSGWQTALLAYMVSKKERGRIIGLEIVPELHQWSIENISKYNYITSGIVQMHCYNAHDGFPREAPFDKIIAAAALLGEPRLTTRAALEEIPPAWKGQLKVGGRLVAPVYSSLVLLIKKADNEFEEHEYPGFVFVPFIPI